MRPTFGQAGTDGCRTGGTVTTVAGNGSFGSTGDGGLATAARLGNPRGVSVDTAGDLYIADTATQRLRRVSSGIITTVAGTGSFGFSGDGGSAILAALGSPTSVLPDGSGGFYFADSANNRVRAVAANGTLTTVAGTGSGITSGDGASAAVASLNAPTTTATDVSGNVYIADRDNHRIRRVDRLTGNITTVAGSGISGFSGDGGLATNAKLDSPDGIALDNSGNLYIADQGNSRIRKVSFGTITTVAGSGLFGFSGDGGAATGAKLAAPRGVAVDATGNIYIADTFNHRVRRVDNLSGNISVRRRSDRQSQLRVCIKVCQRADRTHRRNRVSVPGGQLQVQ